MSDQIMAADQSWLKNQLGVLSKMDLQAVEDAIRTHLALARFSARLAWRAPLKIRL